MRCCCRCYSAALWRRHGCIGPFGRMRVCCDSAATFGVGACRLANRLGALSSSCASPTCASPSLTFLALSRHVTVSRCTSRSRRPVCPGGDAGDARVACSPRLRRESHVRVRICIRAARRELAAVKSLPGSVKKREPVICRRPTLPTHIVVVLFDAALVKQKSFSEALRTTAAMLNTKQVSAAEKHPPQQLSCRLMRRAHARSAGWRSRASTAAAVSPFRLLWLCLLSGSLLPVCLRAR